jgi:SAM-dependent methyltransferase
VKPLELYERALSSQEPMHVRFGEEALAPLPVARYLARPGSEELDLLRGVPGPVLDVGCGPGRYLAALAGLGVYALGVDLSPVAVSIAQRDGNRAVVADVFGHLPGAGAWATALLLDGNIGIGGHPDLLLRRLAALLLPGGTVIAELEAPGSRSRRALARIEAGPESSGWFPWARVSVDDIAEPAGSARMQVEERWRCGERWYARLRAISPA